VEIVLGIAQTMCEEETIDRPNNYARFNCLSFSTPETVQLMKAKHRVKFFIDDSVAGSHKISFHSFSIDYCGTIKSSHN
jgi:hypothetical protein